MKARAHAVAGFLAMGCIATFWIATLAAELLASPGAVLAVKRFVVQGLFVLVPALAIAGASGSSLSARRAGALATRKARRMRVIAANGLLVLVPAALFLRHKAGLGAFDAAFYAVQLLELLAGGINLGLMTLNARDGLRLSGRLGTARAGAA